jgi:hypothetical protein
MENLMENELSEKLINSYDSGKRKSDEKEIQIIKSHSYNSNYHGNKK